MEAEVPPPSAAAGVPGPLRGVAGSRGSEFIADASDGANDPQPCSDQLHLDAKSDSRRARVAAADRGDAAGAVSSDLLGAVLDDELEPAVRLQEVGDHVHLFPYAEHGPPWS